MSTSRTRIKCLGARCGARRGLTLLSIGEPIRASARVRWPPEAALYPTEATLSIEAFSALLELLGIVHDNHAADDPARTMALEARLRELVPEEELRALDGPDRTVTLEIEDAAALLHGLAYTEMMSVDLPWFDMVRWSVDFVTAQLRPLWTDEQWAAVGA